MSPVVNSDGVTYGALLPDETLADLGGNGTGKLSKVQLRSAQLIHDLMVFVRGYVVMTDEQLLIAVLWVIHTHLIGGDLDIVQQTPYLAVNSAEKRSGKSRLLEILEQLCARPWAVILPSEAVLYRKVSASHPTLLLDEIDTVFNPRTGDKYEGLRALLNNGHRQGAKVPRCVGPTSTVVEFDTFCAKVLAGIGTLPDTVADRSIPIRLERKRREDKTKRFLRRDVAPVAEKLHDRVAQWAEVHGEQLMDAQPVMPEALDDRAQEGCEVIVAIADLMGCGVQARGALVKLFTGERLDSEESLRVMLLRDIRTVMGKRNVISTRALIAKLCQLDESPWRTYYGRGINDRDLAVLLRSYSIKSTTVRIKRKKPQPGQDRYVVKKGYKRDALHGAWERYL